MRLDNLLRFDYWLDASVVNQPAGRAMWLVVATGLIGCVVAGWLWRSGRAPRDVALAWIVAGGLVGLVGLSRVFAIPLLGLRIGWLIAALVALAPIVRRLARDVRRDGLIRDCLDAMAFAPCSRPRSLPSGRGEDWHISTVVLWLGFHLIGLTVIFTNINLPIIVAPVLMLVILTPVLVSSIRHQSSIINHQFSCLAPLTITYATALLNLSGQRIEGVLNGLLYVPLSLIVMSAYGFAISCRLSVSGCGDGRFVRGGAAALVVATFAWAAWTALVTRTHGVTGSDPYAYAQMGIDLATRGTVFHPFPLVGTTYDLGISSFPIIHVGYKIPNDASRMATTVWPPGYAVFTALAFIVGGETGVYLVTPLLNLISLGVIAWFAYHVSRITYGVSRDGQDTRYEIRHTPYAIIALTIFFTATSYQQVEWQMTPMADIAAQLFSILALTLALRARGSLLLTGLSGLALGVAFDIRYTQVLMAPAVALALAWTTGNGRQAAQGHDAADMRSSIIYRLPSIVVCALAALIAALPVLVYHTVAFGGPFHVGSEELTNFSLTRLPETLLRTLDELNHYREFRWLTPLILIGVAAMWRRNRRVLAVFAVYFVAPFLFHIAYAYLRLRDILFLFPVLHFLAALGVVELWRWVSVLGSKFSVLSSERTILPTHKTILPFSILNSQFSIFLICALSFLFVLRSMETLSLPVLRGFNGFGYLAPGQRQSFDVIGALTPADAVIGSTLNSGAIDLYARRLTFRPQTWEPDELTKFVDRLHEERRPVYVLDDGEELQPALRTLRKRYTVREAGRVDVPYYFKGSGSENRRVALFKIEAQK